MSTLNRVVRIVQMATAVATAAFIILLFANEPQKPVAVPTSGRDTGQAIYATRCASCHGADGGGGFGPTLAGVVAQQYPNIADQVALVTNGRGSMPSFGGSLTPAQISAVVEYTRTQLP
jgi:mono/diheme cytochrome c family protein